MYYWLFSEEFMWQMEALQKGASYPAVTDKEVRDQAIPFPPLSEQQRIVTLLDEAFDSIATAKAHAEKNLQNARAIFESHLQAVFTQRGDGWYEKTLDQIGKTQTGSTLKTNDRANYGDFISFVKPGDFNTDGTLDYDKDGLSESGAAGARKVPAGSVLMVCIGATIGKCGYCDQDVTTNQQVNALTPSDGSSHRFIYYQMLTETFQRKVIHASGQATLPIINKSKWSALTVSLPPKVDAQTTIAVMFDALLEETQHLEAVYQQKLTALDELKKSLLHRAFSGQL
jgi:type I restriction enzyme S subunit